MHDIRAIRENPAAFDAALSRRGMPSQSPAILAMDEERRAAIHAAETAQAEQNKASKEVGKAKASGDEAEFERLRALFLTTWMKWHIFNCSQGGAKFPTGGILFQVSPRALA